MASFLKSNFNALVETKSDAFSHRGCLYNASLEVNYKLITDKKINHY
jgi:hypothetical protein